MGRKVGAEVEENLLGEGGAVGDSPLGDEDEDEDTGVVGAILLAEAREVEVNACAASEKEGKPGSFCGFSFPMLSPPGAVDVTEGAWDARAVVGAASPVP